MEFAEQKERLLLYPPVRAEEGLDTEAHSQEPINDYAFRTASRVST